MYYTKFYLLHMDHKYMYTGCEIIWWIILFISVSFSPLPDIEFKYINVSRSIHVQEFFTT